MKRSFILATLVAFSIVSKAQNVGIGTSTPHSSAAFEVSSTTSGLLVPRLTSAQRTAISSPAQGLLVYDTDLNAFWFYNGTAWTASNSATLTFPYSANASSTSPIFTIQNTGAGIAIRGTSLSGHALHGASNANGLNGAALKLENLNAAGIAQWNITNSSDANTVISNSGSGDLIRGFSGPSAGNLVYRVLNNGSITTTGNLGIGSTAPPTSRLEVTGNVKIVDGTQGIRKVLSSDAVGNASWSFLPGAIAFKAINFSSQSFAPGPETQINTTLKDYDISNNLTGSQFNVPTNGIYQFVIKSTATANNVDNENYTRFTLRLKRNGLTMEESAYQNAMTPISLRHSLYLNASASLVAGDVITVTFEAEANGAVGPVYLNNTSFTGFRVY